jgi:hypothetical protein
MAAVVKHVELRAETIRGFDAYVQSAEASMEKTPQPNAPFLWCEQQPDRSRRVHGGEIVTETWSGHGPGKVPQGLIHDWIGAAFVPGTTITELLALIQNYDNHKNIYQPEVMDSRLLHRSGNDFQIFLRLLKKKIITVVLDTDHDVHYHAFGKSRWECRSYTTRIAEVENAGAPNETILAPGKGYGFLWRLYSYWRFEERNGGAYLECRAISLTRDIPFGLGWAIEPIIQQLPKESLANTLAATRAALQTSMKAASPAG